jgi:hypothetical protein
LPMPNTNTILKKRKRFASPIVTRVFHKDSHPRKSITHVRPGKLLKVVIRCRILTGLKSSSLYTEYIFNDISADGKYLHAMMTHISILHKQVQWKSVGCERCKEISADINDDKLTGQISMSTLKKIKEHIKLLHASHQRG